MKEYLKPTYMEKLTEAELPLIHSYFIPHRAVLPASSNTTKLRVVFNASAKAKGKLSLNEILMTGPKVQPDLSEICRYLLIRCTARY